MNEICNNKDPLIKVIEGYKCLDENISSLHETITKANRLIELHCQSPQTITNITDKAMKIGISIEIGIPKEVLQWAKRYGESADMTRKTMKELNESEKVLHPLPP